MCKINAGGDFEGIQKNTILDRYHSCTWMDICLWGVIGATLFLIIYGITPLNVINDHWILNGYVEPDVTAHYAGWIAYRNSKWLWPLGQIDGLGNTLVTYTDSIPWFSIFFKLLSPVLPEVFQFFGIYIFLCFILQGIASGLVLNLISEDKILIYCGVTLFCISPIMMERAFRHTALASHWLIIFAIYLYIKSRKEGRMSYAYCLLSVLSIGIHPYFLPMLFSIMLVNVLEIIFINRKLLLNTITVFGASLVTTLAAGYVIGALGTSSSLGGGGFGYFSMNLNAIINPISCGNIKWSLFLPVLSQTLGNYDGFNYLGLGSIILIILAIVIAIVKGKKSLFLIKKNIWIIFLCIGLFLFAISNVVTLNGEVVFEYPLPQKLLDFAAIFRASSRMFYPVFYFLMFAGIYALAKLGNTWRMICIGLILMIQIVDLSPAIRIKHESFDAEYIERVFDTSDFGGSKAWESVFTNFKKMKLLNAISDFKLAAFSERYNLSPDISISSSHYGGTVDFNQIYQDNINEILSGDIEESAVYITNNSNLVIELLSANSRIFAYNLGNYYVISSVREKVESDVVNLKNWHFCASYLTDGNWSNGISTWGLKNVILFQYSSAFMDMLKNSSYIVSGENFYHIENIEYDDTWIRVMVDKQATDCQYPNILFFE